MACADYANAASVLVGSTLIALALWRGLAEVAGAVSNAGAPRPAAVEGARSATVEAPKATARATTPNDPELAAQDRKIRLSEQALDALTAQQPEYVKACWKPKPPAPRQPADLGAMFQVSLSFGADGVEVKREVQTGHGSRELLACVRRQKLAPLRIPALGNPVSLKVSMVIP